MPKPNAAAPVRKKAPQANGSTHPPKSRSANSRLHLALGAALVIASLVALAVPITGIQASGEGSSEPHAINGAGRGLSDALNVQAVGVTQALAQPVMSNNAGRSGLNHAIGGPFMPEALLGAVGRIAAGSVFSSPQAQAAMVIQRQHPASFTVHESGYSSTYSSSQMTVGRALAGLGIEAGEHDLVSPSPASALTPGTHIYIRHALNAQLTVAGAQREVFTHATTVGGMLSEAGLALEPLDRVSPRIETPLRRGIRVTVTTVRDVVNVTEEAVAFETSYKYDSEVLKGRELLDQAGSDGSIRREYSVRLINGKEVRRELISETVVPSVEEIITVGTYVRPTPAPVVVAAPSGDVTCARSLNVYATWYTAASAGGSGTTRTGTGVYKGIVAVDPRVIPLGTRMYIPGYGYGLAADTGSGIIGNMIDLGYGADDVKDWRTHWVEICIF